MKQTTTKKRLLQAIALTLITSTALLISCTKNKESNTTSTPTSKIIASFNSVTTKLDTAAKLSPKPKTTSAQSLASQVNSPIQAAPFGTNWNTTTNISLVDPEGGSAPLSIYQYLTTQFDPDSKRANNSATNAFGRFDDALSGFCGVGYMIDDLDADGYPIDNTYSITLTQKHLDDWASYCNIVLSSDSGSNYVGETLSITVATATDTTLYDKTITATLPFSTNAFVFHMRDNGTTINIATTEKTNDNNEARTSVMYNLSDQTFKAEYISMPAASVETNVTVYRFYMTGSTAYILAWESGDDTQFRTYAGAGDMNDDTITCALSFYVSAAYNQASSTNYINLNGCINRNTGIIASDDDLNCGVSLSSIADSEDVYTLISNKYLTKKTATGWNSINLTTGSLTFSDQSDIYTSAPVTP